ncbi:MAG: ribonuclease R family protein [Phycisphaerales bacterium]
MTSKYQRRLLEHLAHETYTPARVGDIAKDLNIPKEELEDFAGAVADLAGRGLVEVGQSGHVLLPSLATIATRSEESHTEGGKGEITGVFRKTLKGFGFVQPDQKVREGSVFVPADGVGDALTGDRVRVKLFRDRRPGEGPSYIGAVTEVVQRHRSTYTGVLTRRGQQWLALPDGKQITMPIVIRDAESSRAREGDKVVIELVAWPEGGTLGEGVVVRVLGDAGKPDVETQAVIAAFDLPGEFPEACVQQARDASAEFDAQIAAWRAKGPAALHNRRDITKDFILTIDPPDAKDYDDAISIRRLPEGEGGGWELGVHIADVAHFIEIDSALDMEARDRANSCYLPRMVIPMLPEVLSNGICSLQEGVPRFCKSAYMRYNARGEVQGEGVVQTLIQSAKRLTYLEAQALIDGDLTEARRHAKTPPKYTDQLLEALREMNALAKQIQARRDRQGMIVLDLPEVVLKYDDHGHVVDAEQEDDAFTHKLIEMFMVEANEVVARLFEGLRVPLLRRIHPEPVPGNVDGLRKVAMVAGFRIPRNPTREELQGLVRATHGSPAARAVHFAVLRTMSKAEYSPALVGHFALASSAYAHFTSPIRRYADLTVHRATEEYLEETDNGAARPRGEREQRALGEVLKRRRAVMDEDTLAQIGAAATRREVNAESAERELRQFLVLQLLEKHIGENFRAIITGINQRGIFVQIERFLADGFVKSEDLPGDVTRGNMTPFWKIDARTGALVDQRSGRSFNFGDTVTIRIVKVDLAKRQMDCVVDDAASRAGGKAKKVFDRKGNVVGGGMDGTGGGLAGGGAGGGMGRSQGAGFGGGAGWDKETGKWRGKTGDQKRGQRSKSRDQRKKHHRRDKD